MQKIPTLLQSRERLPGNPGIGLEAHASLWDSSTLTYPADALAERHVKHAKAKADETLEGLVKHAKKQLTSY